MRSTLDPSNDSAVVIVDLLPLRGLVLVSVLDRLFPTREFKVLSLAPREAEKWILTDGNCRMILYNIGGGSVGEHKHLKCIRTLIRQRVADVPVVVVADNNQPEEVILALKAGVQGFLYAGTNVQFAQQVLSFILDGGAYFPPTTSRRGHAAAAPSSGIIGVSSDQPLEERAVADTIDPKDPQAHIGLTERQKAVLETLSRGD